MWHRSNTAEEWEPRPELSLVEREDRLDLLPPATLNTPLWRSLGGNLRDIIKPERLPPLQLTSRPVDVGLLLGDRVSLPWFRTIFSNIGDVVSPETLPPLVLESQPVDVGELLNDRLSHMWWTSLIRNLADRVAPETMPALQVTSKPVLNVIGDTWLTLPLWSEVLTTPKVFYPDRPKEKPANAPMEPRTPAVPSPAPVAAISPVEAEVLRDLRRSRIRQRIWAGLAVAQVGYLLASILWLH